MKHLLKNACSAIAITCASICCIVPFFDKCFGAEAQETKIFDAIMSAFLKVRDLLPGNVLVFRDEKNNAIIILYSKQCYKIAEKIKTDIETELNKAETIKDLRIQLLSTQQALYILAQKTTPDVKHKDDQNTYENLVVGDLPIYFGSLTQQLLQTYQLLAKDLINQDKIPENLTEFGSLFYPNSMSQFTDHKLSTSNDLGVFTLALLQDIKYKDGTNITVHNSQKATTYPGATAFLNYFCHTEPVLLLLINAGLTSIDTTVGVHSLRCPCNSCELLLKKSTGFVKIKFPENVKLYQYNGDTSHQGIQKGSSFNFD